MKGKVLTSMAHGVPCVASPVAAEGIGSSQGALAVAETDAFAAEVISVHEDAARWRSQSQAGMRWIDEHVSVERGRARLSRLLAEIGAPLPRPGTVTKERAILEVDDGAD
jgi:glycosyltransferase involved in cell wall biosynthesis